MKTAIQFLKRQSLTFLLANLFLVLGANHLSAQSIPSNAVAYVTSSGGVQIYENRLVHELLSGDPILYFQVIMANGNPYLLRKGISNGYAVTEIVPLVHTGSWLLYVPTYFKFCGTQRCDGLSINQYCAPIWLSGQFQHCECLENDEEPCHSALGQVIVDDYEVLHPLP